MTKGNNAAKKVFFLLMVVYAVAVLSAAAYGLSFLWKYLEVYEQCQDSTALRGYWQTVNPEKIVSLSQELIDSVDHNIQSEQACKDVLLDAVSGKLTYAKKVAQSTEDHHIYVIQCDGRVIGSMEMRRRIPKEYGLYAWEVTGEEYDLSYLLTDVESLEVPQFYTVSANGIELSDAYITKKDTKFQEFGDFYDRFGLPYIYTYTAGPCLGSLQLSVTDQDGSVVEADAVGVDALNNCSAEERTAIEDVCNRFITAYVRFTSKQDGRVWENYEELRKYLVRGGELEDRMHAAINGIIWSSQQHPEIKEIKINYCWSLGNDRYLCDVTYTVDTWDYSGEMTTTRNDRIVFVNTQNGLRAEDMVNY